MRTAVLALCALMCLESAAQAQVASYYGKELAGRRTASGERFNPGAMTAAHRTLPFGTRVRVTNIQRPVGDSADQRSRSVCEGSLD